MLDLSTKIWRKAPSDNPIRLDDPSFGAVADGIIYTNGSTNYLAATDNTLAIKAWIEACRDYKREGFVPPGNWMYRQGNVINIANANGVRLRGVGEDSKLLWCCPNNLQGIALGQVGSNRVSAETSPITLSAGTSTASTLVSLTTTTPGELPTQRLFKGMQLYLSDPSQPIKYRAAAYNPAIPGTIAFYKGTFCQIKSIIDGYTIELAGITEWDFNPGTKVGYWFAPNLGVSVRDLCFVYDTVNSYQGGASSALVIAGCIDPEMYNIKSLNATSRAFAWRDSVKVNVDTLIGEATVSGSGSLSTSTGCGLGMFRNLRGEGGTHTIDFGGGLYNPSLHCQIIGVTSQDPSGGVIGSHKAAGYLKFSYIDIVGNAGPWNRDNNPDTDEFDRDTAITMRGYRCEVSYATVSRCGIAFRSHKNAGHIWSHCTAFECGRGFYIDDTDQVTIYDAKVESPTWLAIHINMITGPAQNLDLITNHRYNGIEVTGTPGTQGDMYLYCAGQYDVEERFRNGGWSFTNLNRNGGVFVIVGEGTAVGKFPQFTPSTDQELSNQLVAPAYPMAPGLGANSIVVTDTSGVTESYSGSAVQEVPGGTLAATGRSTLVRIETLTVASIAIAYGGLLQAPGDILTLEGGAPNTRATFMIDTVAPGGIALTGHLISGGDYKAASSTFGQYSTTGLGTNTYVTAVTIRNPGRRFIVGEVVMAVSGNPVRIDGVPQGPTIRVDAVDSLGSITAITLLTGGEFYELSPSLVLDQRETSGDGVGSSFNITGSVDRRVTFGDALIIPLTASILRAGKYTVTPTNPTELDPITGTGAGALFTVSYGMLVDVGQSPKELVQVTGSGSSIIGLGPRRGSERRLVFTGIQSLVAGATLVLPIGGGTITTAAGDTLSAWSDFSVPVVWTISNFTKKNGTVLIPAIQRTPTAKTSGTTLTAAELRNGIITVSSATAQNYTLPLASAMDAGATDLTTDDAFDLSIVNINTTAAGDATILTNDGWTLVGNMVVESNDDPRARSSGRFRARKTGTALWTLYRLS